jgi:hypothetical protein
VTSLTTRVIETLQSLTPIEVVINNVLQTLGLPVTLDEVISTLIQVVDGTTPGSSNLARLVRRFGEHIVICSTNGFVIGLCLGLGTLVAAVSQQHASCTHRSQVTLDMQLW